MQSHLEKNNIDWQYDDQLNPFHNEIYSRYYKLIDILIIVEVD